MTDEHRKRFVKEGGGWNSYGFHKDTASVLTCDNVSIDAVQNIIQKYNVSFIFTKSYDTKIAYIFFRWFDKNNSGYIIDFNLTNKAN